jgi:hypothetical protein
MVRIGSPPFPRIPIISVRKFLISRAKLDFGGKLATQIRYIDKLSYFGTIAFLWIGAFPMDERRVSLKIDISRGTIELDAPADSFEDAIARTRELTSSLDFRGMQSAAEAPSTPRKETTEIEEAAAPPPQEASQPSRSKTRGTKVSAGRPGRIGSFEQVKDLLPEAKEIELRKFFSQKSPKEQIHQVLTAVVKGEELLSKKGLTYNDIYTLMWIGGVKPLPKAIDVVLTRLFQDQFVTRENGGFSSKFLGREFVENSLPASQTP